MNSLIRYLKGVAFAFQSLAAGMRLTLLNFTRPWKTIITEQYPENRSTTIYIPERFAGEVELPHDENNEHKCTACTLCEMACPNGTIKIISKQEDVGEGKTKKVLDKWVYNLGMCTFCQQCIEACPQDAIRMKNSFELSVYDRADLIKVLNKP